VEKVTDKRVFGWFIELPMDTAVRDVTRFTRNRGRLLRGDVAGRFIAAVLAACRSSRCRRRSTSRWMAH
jgi:hypothetical protein